MVVTSLGRVPTITPGGVGPCNDARAVLTASLTALGVRLTFRASEMKQRLGRRHKTDLRHNKFLPPLVSFPSDFFRLCEN